MTRLALRRTFVAALAGLALGGCGMMPGGSGATRLAGDLSGTAEVPPTASTASGRVEATLDANNVLRYKVTYSGMSGPVTAGHFHGPGMPGQNAGVALPFKSTASPIEGEATLTAEQKADVLAGKWYANLHTAANPGGEIRGQLTTSRY